jgi:hypothetical protein
MEGSLKSADGRPRVSPRDGLYDQRNDAVALDEIERVVY